MNTNIFRVVLLFLPLLCWSCESQKRSNDNGGDILTPEDELVEVEEKYEDECDYCDGSGLASLTCSACGGTGVKYHASSETRPKECYNCYGTGVRRCETCGGEGYTRCQYCNGHGSYQCTVCNGYGIIVIDPSRPHLSPSCNNCNGTGYEKCSICRGNGKLKCCGNGVAKCPVCWGSGYYGQENVSNSGIEKCNECDGIGKRCALCDECDGSGIIIKTRVVQKKKSSI